MKKITIGIMTVFMLLTTISSPLKAGSEPRPAPMSSAQPVKSAEANSLLHRLDEIKAMDKSKMSSPQKKQLRKEVRSIKSSLNTLGGGGVYISVGALIIIIILLIILL